MSAPRALRVLHVLAPGEFGGLERVVHTLAAGHQGLGHDVHVAAVLFTETAGHPFVDSLVRAGVTVHPIVLGARAYARERAAIVDLSRKVRPDVIHTHGYRADVVVASAAGSLGIPIVSTAHGATGCGWRERGYEWLQRRAFRRFAAVAAASRPYAQRIRRSGVPAGKVHAVPNAWHPTTRRLSRVEARRALRLDAREYLVGWVGRLSHEKGPDVLLDALRYLVDLPVSAAFLGGGPERPALEAHARSASIEQRVHWCGVHPDAARFFAAFDVFALSSRTEGTPMVLFEAMAANVPLVVTRVGGVPDVVSPSEAILVEPERPVALAAAIRLVHDERAAALQRTRAAQELLREHRVEPWLSHYEAIYRGARAASGVD